MQRRVHPALVFFLCFCFIVSLSGCDGLLQLSRSELARANSFISSQPLEISIYTIASDSVITIHHKTEVLACGSDAIWDGTATAHYYGSEFTQKCNTVCADGLAYKAWRGKWVASFARSPVTQISQWLQMVGQGMGYYDKTPATANELPSQFSGIDGELYCITLSGQHVDWSAISDMHPDSFFGGEELLNQHKTAHVNLYFGAEDRLLKGIIVSAGEMSQLVNVYIKISPADTAPSIDFSQLEIVEGTLSEEWELKTK